MAKRVFAALCALFWGYWGYIGFDLVSGVAKRVAPGRPTMGQWELYVIFPAAMTLLGIGLVIFAKRAPAALYAAIAVAEIIPILPFLMIYGGGV